MDFALDETQQAVAAAAAHVLDHSPPPSTPAGEDTDDRALWKELGQAGLLGLALPGWLGGDGLGVMGTAVLLTEAGRRAAPVPALTTAHVGTRTQFGRPLAAFQAVAQRIADVHIVSRTLHLAALSACWRLDTGRDAGGDLDVAAYWLAGQAPAALRACHHLHGGTGMDVSYPLHRYSALVKDLARLAGGADYRLGRLGTRVGEPCSAT